jgi:hypothetical protein
MSLIKVISCLLSFVIVLCNIGSAKAISLEELQKECEDLGLKIGTPANGNCVLKLRKKVKESQARDEYMEAQQMQMYRERQQQQAAMYELQSRSVAAQEALANAQREAVQNNLLYNGIQMLRGSGPYGYPTAPSRAPITCHTFSNVTTCN